MNWSFPIANSVLNIDVPKGWRNTSDATAISFSSASETAALTVSVYDRTEVDKIAVERINASVQPFGVPISDKRSLPMRGSTGFARDFKKKRGDAEIIWTAHFVFLPGST